MRLTASCFFPRSPDPAPPPIPLRCCTNAGKDGPVTMTCRSKLSTEGNRELCLQEVENRKGLPNRHSGISPESVPTNLTCRPCWNIPQGS